MDGAVGAGGVTSDARELGERAIDTTRRRGRMSEAKRHAVATLGPDLGLDLSPSRPLGERLSAAFGRVAPRMVDVGVGDGAAVVAWAAAHPEHDVVALEVHRPSLASTLVAVHESGLPNVRVVDLDVRALLAQAAPGDLHAVRILFPDPWPKRRHRRRRLVDDPFVAAVARVLPPGGDLHVATDWTDYADQVLAATGADGRFRPVGRVPRPDRPTTPYERRGLHAGRAITDVVAVRAG